MNNEEIKTIVTTNEYIKVKITEEMELELSNGKGEE